MARKYEVVYIFDSTLEEPAITERLTRYHALLGGDPAQIEVNHWGKRALAHAIKKRETGYYVVAKFEAAANTIPEFERALKLDDAVLRHLMVLHEGAQPAPLATEKSEDDDE